MAWETSDSKRHNDRNYATRDEVVNNLSATGYPMDRIRAVVGKVEDTVPEHAPQQIALLRLDTDFYSSTKHELIHLFPRLSRGGVVIIDDYGAFQGARQAVDKYIAETKCCLLLNRIDADARIGVKL